MLHSPFRFSTGFKFLVAGNLFAMSSPARFLETNSFREGSNQENEQRSAQARYLDSSNLRDNSFGEHRYNIVNDFQPSTYVDSSAIRGGGSVIENSAGDQASLQFSPMQFPAPLKYDESNAIRYPYSQTAKSSSVTEGSESHPPQPTYKSSLFKDRDIGESPDIGYLEIGESSDTGFNNHGEFHHERDIEIYHNPIGDNPYSGESIDIEHFDGVPAEIVNQSEDLVDNHPGDFQASGGSNHSTFIK